jgi:zinc transport system substrate-binding protein
MATAQARAIYDTLIGLMPDHKKEMNLRFRQLKVELEGLDRQLIRYSKNNKGKAFITSYPVYQYLGQRYHFDIYSLLWKPDQIPNEREWKKLITILKEHQAGTMLWEAEPLPEVRQELEKIGLKLYVFNPCGNRPESGDFMSVMWDNVYRFTESGKHKELDD